MQPSSSKRVGLLVLVASLGYFVDIYDLILFNVVKKESLLDIFGQLSIEEMIKYEMNLFSYQMVGMLLGGILWGIWGDKKGRVSVMFGSIMLYSFANIANAFVTDLTSYSVLRFIAGVGLAGELGAGITLVVESMDKKTRGWGTMVVVTVGVCGAVVASLVGTEGHYIAEWIYPVIGVKFSNWQIAYLLGGIMGLCLLVMRAGAFESGMFKEIQQKDSISKGNITLFFNNKRRFYKYLNSILLGLPIWLVVGILVGQSDKIAMALGVHGEVKVSDSIMYAYIGLCLGDFSSGFLSQILKTRKKVILGFQVFLFLICAVYLINKNVSVTYFKVMCGLLGFAAGYWALFVTNAAEQFGTNIRSLASNTIPNFVRGAVWPLSELFKSLLPAHDPISGILSASISITTAVFFVAFIATYFTEETFGKDLDYVEE
jgi:MFS family permease